MDLQISIPKAGTHLFGFMTQCQTGIITIKPDPQTKPADQFIPTREIVNRLSSLDNRINYRSHLPYHPSIEKHLEQFGRVILILRDPRDIINSHAHYVFLHPHSPLNYITGRQRLNQLPFTSRVNYLIQNMRPVFDLFDKWRMIGGVDVFYYEQYITARADLYLKLSQMGYGSPAEIATRAGQRGASFRVGSMGEWRQTFTDVQIDLCNKLFADLIEAWQ